MTGTEEGAVHQGEWAAWQPFIGELCEVLGVEEDAVEVPRLMVLTRQVSQHVTRPMAPVAAYLAGLGVAAGLGSFDEVAARIEGVAVGQVG